MQMYVTLSIVCTHTSIFYLSVSSTRQWQVFLRLRFQSHWLLSNSDIYTIWLTRVPLIWGIFFYPGISQQCPTLEPFYEDDLFFKMSWQVSPSIRFSAQHLFLLYKDDLPIFYTPIISERLCLWYNCICVDLQFSRWPKRVILSILWSNYNIPVGKRCLVKFSDGKQSKLHTTIDDRTLNSHQSRWTIVPSGWPRELNAYCALTSTQTTGGACTWDPL